MKQFKVTATWTVPYNEKEAHSEFYETPDEYVEETSDTLKDSAWKAIRYEVPPGNRYTITVEVVDK